ncbi:hypothetical protein JQ615_20470 [Bradyrhizobium jicamae]|uniref:Uncharacterized protein n=1 Tax=Bradyrhizobium jicamae TaxID=280332 RepID=A0ABS5FLT2_9BRAD|nr:hypothetical protein [Bradyrhizobium jicamae]MBR0797763.1 hypothetical protein [Bradyrhizobium jicamae]MBR0933304.1 hypothetical protein [Bradyrhizobium jicamae]
MTRLIFVVAALVAVAIDASVASAATRHAQAAGSKAVDCVRAPNVGAYATAPYTQPPCMPGTTR